MNHVLYTDIWVVLGNIVKQDTYMQSHLRNYEEKLWLKTENSWL